MQADGGETIYYKRSRFTSRLPVGRLYAPSHFWLLESGPGVLRVGFTRFATRMLGDLVEQGFGVKPGDRVAVGQAIGWVEGFKALTDLYCAVDGEFVESNPALAQDPTLTDSDPYGAGWLYSARGSPDPNATDVQGYIRLLDLTIDTMQDKAVDASGGADRSESPSDG